MKAIGRTFATAILRERITEGSVIRRAADIFGRHHPWVRTFARRVAAQFGEGGRPRRFRLERFILADTGFRKAYAKGKLTFANPIGVTAEMCPAPGPPEEWAVPPLRHPGELASWLNLRQTELAWFADCRTLEQKLPEGSLRHYRYRWKIKRNGSVRLIESPKQHVKMLQRRLLAQILDRIPPHESAHGFRTGRSIRTFAEAHCGHEIVFKLDLKDFFPSIRRARVLAIFMTAGYPEEVAGLLTGLCTNAAPTPVIATGLQDVAESQRWHTRSMYQCPHLPQGAPTSPALANLAAYRLDRRLAGLAGSAGARYTRYADDLVFSGDRDFARVINRFHIRICAIAFEEGFEVNTRKTRIMRRAVSQRAAGLVLNSHVNVPRIEFDRLKAILHNCAVHGPAGQNRDRLPDFRAHLSGRIAHVETIHPARGGKLRRAFERIEWT